MKKSTKSQQGGLAPSSLQPPRRARVSRASHAWRVCVAKGRAKVGGFIAPHSFIYTTRANTAHEIAEQIRARIVCTPAYIGVAGVNLARAMTELFKISPVLLCSHPDAHPNLNREVRHSLTWHSSKSESALERFEPVAMVQQLPDGRGSVFAPVAARRQKEIKRGILSSFCPFRSFRTSEKNSEREVS